MEAARRVFGDEACQTQVIHSQTPLEALGERVGLWNEFHILSPLLHSSRQFVVQFSSSSPP
jgi:hypothetical protein